MGCEVNVLALIKGDEHYIYIYDDEGRPALLDAFRSQAKSSSLSLTWFDAAVLSRRAREQARKSKGTPLSRSRF